MPLREFSDPQGRVWQAWDTYPKGADQTAQGESAFAKYMANLATADGSRPTPVRPQYEGGWLTFKLGGARRRLTPIPSGWETADDSTLRSYLVSASDIADVVLPRSIEPLSKDT